MKKNDAPFQLVGMHYQDYENWCKHHGLSIYRRENKTEFFKLVRNYRIKKIEGVLYEEGVPVNAENSI